LFRSLKTGRQCLRKCVEKRSGQQRLTHLGAGRQNSTVQIQD
jgi:hypothetical protein